jgi:hypothetical protein
VKTPLSHFHTSKLARFLPSPFSQKSLTSRCFLANPKTIMKKSFFFLFAVLLSVSSLFAQETFEGRIVYEVDLQGENAQQMKAFMPESYEYLISGSNLKFSMKGGMTAAMMGDILVDGEKGTSYMLKASEQVAYKMPVEQEEDSADTPEPDIKKLDETATIAGYECQKYQVSMQQEGKEVTQYMWVTEEIKLKKPKTGSAQNAGQVFVDGLNGFPLKIETEVMGMNMIMEVTTVEKKVIDSNTFAIPKGYEVKDFDPSKF